MSQVTIPQAQAQLSRLIQQALAGEEIVIIKEKIALVKLVPVHQPGTQENDDNGQKMPGALEDAAVDYDGLNFDLGPFNGDYSALDKIVGLGESGKTDGSVNHDKIIYGRRNNK